MKAARNKGHIQGNHDLNGSKHLIWNNQTNRMQDNTLKMLTKRNATFEFYTQQKYSLTVKGK